ncbi:ABC transporter permease family protein [Oecophyllibacter saccharovorans]|uniref:hypothetical protein n=1 Tax=Oecophyllibacter saccharovorans TaxID=2558360 RepID=UPI001883AE8D|nr:hypothetical protein [Oecophyllibacter saccharovorans]
MKPSAAFPLVFRLAWRDLWSEKVMALCLVIGLSATAAPLLLLAGLKAGLVEGMRTTLLQDPHIREIDSAANRTFTATWLDELAHRPDVAFVMPRTRTLAASVLLVPRDRREEARRVELLPTRSGDPLLGNLQARLPKGQADQNIILSASAAASLHVQPGDSLVMRVSRLGTPPETALQPLRVAAVAPASASGRDVGFVSLPLAEAVELYREHTPPLDWQAALQLGGKASTDQRNVETLYPGFRLYARHMENVPALSHWFAAQNVDVVSQAGEIDRLLMLDRSLSALFLLTAILGISGFFLALGTGMWALVQRKRLSLATMGFFGVRGMLWFPVFQGECLALAAIGLALGGATLMGAAINLVFAHVLPSGQKLCLLQPAVYGLALGLTLLGAFVATVLAGWRASRLQPWEGVSAP